jgi:Rrf2 family protein
MMISLTGEYALRAMVFLTRHHEEWPVSGPRIAREAGIPGKYLSAILAVLVRSGLLEATRGKSGGFRMTRPAGEVRLADIVGPFEPVNSHRKTCPFGNAACNDSDPCGAHERWKGVKEALEQFLSETTLEDVARPRGASTIKVRRSRSTR